MKIAVCLSGETRNYNHDLLDTDRQGPMDFVNQLKQHFDVVDIFGHTWSHCGKPVNRHDFKKFRQDDQKVITDWVAQDFVNRTYTDGGNGNFNSINQLNDLGPVAFIDAYLNKSKAIYGQTWSAAECFELVPLDEYDIVIRYRWDLVHDGNSKFFEATVVNRILWLKNSDVVHNPTLVSTCNSHIQTNNPHAIAHIEDTFFIMNKVAHRVFCQVEIGDKLDNIIDLNLGRKHMPAHHGMWQAVLFTHFYEHLNRYDVNSQHMTMHLTLPNMFNISSDPSWASPGSGRDTQTFEHLENGTHDVVRLDLDD